MFEKAFIDTYQSASGQDLPADWQKMLKVQDIINLCDLLNKENDRPQMEKDIIGLIQQTLNLYR